jgi:hypothetical protein
LICRISIQKQNLTVVDNRQVLFLIEPFRPGNYQKFDAWVGCMHEAGARPAAGYPAQLNPPREPQLLLDEPAELADKPPREAIVDNFLWVSLLAHFGQSGVRPASEKLTLFSKDSPQSSQRYS